MNDYVNSQEAMCILGVKSGTTLRDYEKKGFIIAYRPFGSRKRFKVSDLLKVQKKR
jgi:hypothetical protein